MSDPGVFTPYSTVAPLFSAIEDVSWLPDEDQDRIQAYATYDQIYWNFSEVFKITMRGTFDKPVYVPSGKTVVDETAHYLLKGLDISPANEKDQKLADALKLFMKRQRFYSKFHEAKHSGVARGDWILHMTVDEDQMEGYRISVNSVDPASYFPLYSDDDLDRLEGVRLVEQIADEAGGTRVRMLQYSYEYYGAVGSVTRRVIVEEAELKVEGWWKGKPEAVVLKRHIKPTALPDSIQRIPVYHFKNGSWQGDPFGSSEMRGQELLLSAVNQTVSDEELALALEGLGVYATDAPKPTNDDGDVEEWVIAPGMVLNIPGGSEFKRVQGIKSIAPFQDHVEFLQKNLFEGTGTFRSNAIEVSIAESGIALAIKFMPTAAKIEERDNNGLDLLDQFWYEWRVWHAEYEGVDFTKLDLAITLGSKLPINRIELINELNNMLDRKIITRAYYREQMVKRLGYVFPDKMGEEVLAEEAKFLALGVELNPAAKDNEANNGERPNESAGTEADENA